MSDVLIFLVVNYPVLYIKGKLLSTNVKIYYFECSILSSKYTLSLVKD